MDYEGITHREAMKAWDSLPTVRKWEDRKKKDKPEPK
jgi:hypothetical protein